MATNEYLLYSVVLETFIQQGNSVSTQNDQFYNNDVGNYCHTCFILFNKYVS